MKLTEKELRIGSTYHSVKFNVPVRLTAEDIWELVERAEGANIKTYIDEMFTPIKLTEKWIKDFGFKKNASGWGFKGFQINHLFEFQYCYGARSSKNEYVHTFQNLYFALTETELTLKPIDK